MRGIGVSWCISLLALASCGADKAGPPGVVEQSSVASADLEIGEATYEAACAMCHQGAGASGPQLATLKFMGPDAIETALTSGKMAAQGAALEDAERAALISWLTSEQTDYSGWEDRMHCSAPLADLGQQPVFAGSWGLDANNHRAQQNSRLSQQNARQLSEVWSIAFPGTGTMRSQPVIVGDTLFVAVADTQSVYAFDRNSGCLHWQHSVESSPRSALSHARIEGRDVLLVGDTSGFVSLIDAQTGDRVWRKPLGVSAKTTFTGPITVVGDRFFLPHSSTETVASVDPAYECCQLSGAISAHNLSDGETLWVHTTLDAPQKREISAAGTQLWGPAGASVWAAPVFDAERGLIFIGTGPISARPDPGTGDAVIAVDAATGQRRWVFQATAEDFWNGACRAPHPDGKHPNCPGTNGVDFDFGAGLMRVTTPSGRDLLIAGQKSGTAHALDPDTGKIVWQTSVGSGGPLGGIHWGMAYRDGGLFVPVNDPDFTKHPGLSDNYKDRITPYTSRTGLYRLNVETGAVDWEWHPVRTCEPSFSAETAWPECPPQDGLSGAALIAGDVLLAGSMDGSWRVFDPETGDVLGMHSTYKAYDATLNGVPGHGGSIDNASMMAAGDMVFVQSGYGYFGGTPGNMLVAYQLDDKE
jgi:polyvinyl alcohol dehydrogenase (cytochrome)